MSSLKNVKIARESFTKNSRRRIRGKLKIGGNTHFVNKKKKKKKRKEKKRKEKKRKEKKRKEKKRKEKKRKEKKERKRSDYYILYTLYDISIHSQCSHQ